MKKVFILLISIFATTSVFAQVGIKGGANFSKFTEYSNSDYLTGFHIGSTLDIPLSKKFYFQPGLLFTLKGTEFNSNILISEGKVSIYALEVPLLFSFRPQLNEQLKLITNFGPYVNYGLFGSKKYKYENSTVKGSPFDSYNRFDIGLDLGIGLQYKRYIITGEFLMGFNDAEKETIAKNKAFRISLGYLF